MLLELWSRLRVVSTPGFCDFLTLEHRSSMTRLTDDVTICLQFPQKIIPNTEELGNILWRRISHKTFSGQFHSFSTRSARSPSITWHLFGFTTISYFLPFSRKSRFCGDSIFQILILFLEKLRKFLNWKLSVNKELSLEFWGKIENKIILQNSAIWTCDYFCGW